MRDPIKLAVPPERLRYYPKLEKYERLTARQIAPGSQSFCQEKGFEAIDFGVSIKMKGFNIYVAGDPGTGKTSSVKKYLEKMAGKMPIPDDICYVHNFDIPDEPRLILMPHGTGEVLVKDMADLLDYFQYQIPRQLESETFEIKKGEVVRWYQEESERNYHAIEAEAAKLSFTIKSTQGGFVINPIVGGEAIGKEEFDKLGEKERESIRVNEEKLQEKLIAFFHRERVLEKEYKEKMTTLRQSMVRLIIGEPLGELRKKYKKNVGIQDHINSLEKHLLDNFEDFFTWRDINEGKAEAQNLEIPDFREYKVNLLVNNKNLKGGPVIYETNPTFQNIMGYFEYEELHNSIFTDFTKMKPGALHYANGGFLIVQANDILKNYYAWTALKRSMRNRLLKMDDIDVDFRYRVNIFPKPEPVPLNVKLIMIGDDYLYHLLYNYDDDFNRIFRVKADFESTTDITPRNTDGLVKFMARIVQEDCALDFDVTAMRRILHFSSRQAEDQKKYRVGASDLVDIILESDFWARKDKKKIVNEDSVRKAIAIKESRHAKFKKHYYESIDRDIILIDVAGEKIGMINGLAVYSVGDFSFGVPSRITARVFAGRTGIINVDREVRLSGQIHDKGALILAGFLGDIFAQDKPLSLSASITFEQNYGGVEGDSASSTELYALLSALAEVPIKQSIAVTGSVNQLGQIQPIGGVNEKIEGFFEICKMKGLTGTQGVIVPRQNMEHLNLSDEVVQAVQKKKFRIYAIASIMEGIEILTGLPTGNRLKSGKFTPGSLFDKVDQRIRKLNRIK
ncbi:MAG TPA: ATP-binding protein [bacterium]|nr:ATP-binding protein [bacterium]